MPGRASAATASCGSRRNFWEACDDGDDDNSDGCIDTCREAVCGDGFVRLEGGRGQVEPCDDGNLVDTDACTTRCRNAACGDGFVWDGEEFCDDGVNDNTGFSCYDDCSGSIACGRDVPEQSFGLLMRGCAGHDFWPAPGGAADDHCGEGWWVCSGAEWVRNNGDVAPLHNYWVADPLGYGGVAGACWAGPNAPNACLVGIGPNGERRPSPMRVCTPSGEDDWNEDGVIDPDNTCNWEGCGFNDEAPNEYFGGCNGNLYAGALCCSAIFQ